MAFVSTCVRIDLPTFVKEMLGKIDILPDLVGTHTNSSAQQELCEFIVQDPTAVFEVVTPKNVDEEESNGMLLFRRSNRPIKLMVLEDIDDLVYAEELLRRLRWR